MEQLGHLLQAMIVVILNGPPDEIEQTPDAARITPLSEEFSDLFESGKKFLGRLMREAFTDLLSVNGPYYKHSVARERLLRETAVMPSTAIKALAAAIGCDHSARSGVNLRLHRTTVKRTARELGSSSRFLHLCWAAEVDLDQQWRALRLELIRIRAEWAVPA
jgi:hypothetical protein